MKKIHLLNIQNNNTESRFLNNLKSQISLLLDSYEFIENSGISSVITVIIINPLDNYIKGNGINYQNGKIRLYSLNFPNIEKARFDVQDTKDKIFRAKLDVILKKINANETKFDILNIYNKRFEDYNFTNFYKKNENYLFYPTEPKYNFEQIILNDDLREDIFKTLILIEKRKLIYEDWGFNEIDSEPKAILNFFGTSGTGKTMTAHAIAKYMNCKILLLNYADIESKYVGDAPKNLVKAFEIAEKENSVLFFDEADSFLGKRITNISTSSDQAVNSLRSQLLILLENFEGIIIFATNLMKNYDRAFESRIFSHIHFELPNKENRKKIIIKTIPKKVPFENGKYLTNLELEELAELSDNFSGREIKNGILKTITDVVFKNKSFVNFEDFNLIFTNLAIKKENLNNEFGTNKIFNSETKKVIEKKISLTLKDENNKND